MIVVENWSYNVNRILLLVCGLWPYENTKFQCVRAVFVFGVLASFIVDKLVTLFIQEYNFKLALEILSDVLPIGICMLMFLVFLINKKKIKQLLDLIGSEWNALKDSEEIEIAKIYGKLTRRMTTVLLVYGILSSLVLIMMRFISIIIDNFAAANKSLQRQNNISLEQFRSEEKYIYVLVVKFMGIIVITTTLTMMTAYMRHICMMLKITWFSEQIVSNFKYSTFYLISIGVISLAINLLHALQGILSLTDINKMILPMFYVIVHFIYFFVLNYSGQLVIDHSADVSKTLYKIQWYVAPIHVQKLILFIMLKNTKNYGLVMGGIYVVSLESFVTLMSTSISYCMVIYSTQ